MKFNRSLSVGMLLLLGPHAFASLEMLMMVDPTAKVIRRYDPITGVSLGSFGAGVLVNPTDIAVVNHDTVFVSDNYDTAGAYSTIYKMNPHTGEVLGQMFNINIYNAQAIAVSNNGNLYTFDYGSQVNVGKFNTLKLAYTGSTFNHLGVAAVAQDLLSTGGETFLMSYGTSFGTASFAAGSFVAVATGSTIRAIEKAGNQYVTASATGAITVYQSTLTGATTLLTAQTGLSSAFGLAMGHQMVYASGNDASGNRKVAILNPVTRTVVGSFSVSNSLSTGKMAIILAPEPGSLAILGFGALTMLLRRRS